MRSPPQLTVQLLLATPIILGHQLHGQIKLNAGQQWPRRFPLDAQRAEVVESAALLVIDNQVQERVAVAGDWDLKETKVRCRGRAQATTGTMFRVNTEDHTGTATCDHMMHPESSWLPYGLMRVLVRNLG